jgi:hypothetical protein
LTNRNQPSNFSTERDRRADELLAEANRLEEIAVTLFRQSRQHSPNSDEYATLRQQAREHQSEAAHYRATAGILRDRWLVKPLYGLKGAMYRNYLPAMALRLPVTSTMCTPQHCN